MTQNNRANRLSEIASLPGEDRRARLLAALAAYDEALRFRRPDTAPLAYAATQNNRANLLSAIASLPARIGARACWPPWPPVGRQYNSIGVSTSNTLQSASAPSRLFVRRAAMSSRRSGPRWVVGPLPEWLSGVGACKRGHSRDGWRFQSNCTALILS